MNVYQWDRFWCLSASMHSFRTQPDVFHTVNNLLHLLIRENFFTPLSAQRLRCVETWVWVILFLLAATRHSLLVSSAIILNFAKREREREVRRYFIGYFSFSHKEISGGKQDIIKPESAVGEIAFVYGPIATRVSIKSLGPKREQTRRRRKAERSRKS